jgi:hypothetical protein
MRLPPVTRVGELASTDNSSLTLEKKCTKAVEIQPENVEEIIGIKDYMPPDCNRKEKISPPTKIFVSQVARTRDMALPFVSVTRRPRSM